MRWTVLSLALIGMLVGLLAWLVLRDDPAGGRLVREGPGDGAQAGYAALPGAQAGGADDRSGGRPESPPLPVVATLAGQVFDPRGRPLHRAEVWILRPRPMRLSITDEEGRFELPLHRRGKHLLEAEWFTDLQPERRTVDVPETGDPPAIAFHLKPAGTVWGELTAGGEPVSYAEVDVYDGDKWILDTEAENGLFVFREEPPVGKALELRVKASEGYPKQPVRFTWPGTPLDLGTIELQRFPSCAVRVVLPDGSEAEHFEARTYAGTVPPPEDDPYGMLTRLPSRGTAILEQDSVLRISPAGPRTLETWIGTPAPGGEGAGYKLRAVLTFDETPRAPVELAIRPGPFSVRGSIVDDRDRPVVCRFRVAAAADREYRTDAEGRFEVEVPFGGVHVLCLSSLDLPEGGGVIAPRVERVVFATCWFDADRPGEPCRFQATGRVLFLSAQGGSVRVGRGATRDVYRPLLPLNDGGFAAITPPLDAPEGTEWSFFAWPRGAELEQVPLELEAKGLTVIRIGG